MRNKEKKAWQAKQKAKKDKQDKERAERNEAWEKTVSERNAESDKWLHKEYEWLMKEKQATMKLTKLDDNYQRLSKKYEDLTDRFDDLDRLIQEKQKELLGADDPPSPLTPHNEGLEMSSKPSHTGQRESRSCSPSPGNGASASEGGGESGISGEV